MKKLTVKTVKIQLEGINGNTHRLIERFTNQAKKQGWTDSELSAVLNHAHSEDHDTLLTLLTYCEAE